MDAKSGRSSATNKHQTTVERTSERELVVTRTFDAPARIVFEAWTTPALMQRWWTPKSFGITFVSCEMDARTGGTYRFVFSHPDFPEPMSFFGRYIDVAPPTRLVWTNEENGEAGAVTTVTFTEQNGQTVVVLRDLYPSKEALDEAIASGSTGGWSEQFNELDVQLAAPGS